MPLYVSSTCAHHQEVKIAYRCDDTRGCVTQFWPPDGEHMCSKHVQAWNKTYCKTNLLCIKLVNYWDKFISVFRHQIGDEKSKNMWNLYVIKFPLKQYSLITVYYLYSFYISLYLCHISLYLCCSDVIFCVVHWLIVLFYVVLVCKCVLPPGDHPIAVNK